jgi:hypothetical protein
MALNSTHPHYDSFIVDWRTMRHTYAGQRIVKKEGTRYLPATPGQILDGQGTTGKTGEIAYEAYKTRAIFPDFVSDAVEAYVGLLHQKPATFELPEAMKFLLEKASIDKETLLQLLRRINEQQLVSGRVGLLLDLPQNPDPANPMPYIAMYVAEALVNWDDSNDKQGVNEINLVILNESSFERSSDFQWVQREKYRVLMLGPQQNKIDGQEVEGDVYETGVFYVKDGNEIDPSQLQAPNIRGKTLDKIPFVFVNSKDIIPTPDNPPLLGLAHLSLSIYRGEADYRHSLFMQSQDTLVVIGGLIENPQTDGTVRVGAGARLDVNLGGDAKYVGVTANGLSEQRIAIENDTKKAQAKSGQLIAPAAGKQESGDALQTRLAAQTATLNQIALTGAAGLERILKACAEWMGLDSDQVKVIPNLEFADFVIDSRAFVELMSARSMGAPLSLESIHSLAVDRGLTGMTFEEEINKIVEEDAGRAKTNAQLGLDPKGDVIPPPPAPPASGAKGPAST